MRNTIAANALKDIKRQIDIEEWAIPTNDRGSGSAGVSLLNDTEAIDKYLTFAETGDNDDVPQCEDIYYVSKDQFDEEEKEIVEEMLNHVDFIEANEVLGLVVCMEHYDMPYEFYILHIEG